MFLDGNGFSSGKLIFVSGKRLRDRRQAQPPPLASSHDDHSRTDAQNQKQLTINVKKRLVSLTLVMLDQPHHRHAKYIYTYVYSYNI
jgi:hypothetical protein